MTDIADPTKNRVKISEKRMINSQVDVNQLVPFKYPWAWSMYLKSCENHWMPQETHLDNIAQRYRNSTPQIKNIIDDLLTILAGGPMMLYRSVTPRLNKDYVEGMNVLFMYRHNTAPECRQYLLRQGFEEATKDHLYNYLMENIQPDNLAYGSVVVTQNTIDLVYSSAEDQDKYNTQSEENAIKYIKFLIENIIIQKGYVNIDAFVRMLELEAEFPDLLKLFGFVFRDNMNHVQFALRVINTIFEENPHLKRTHPGITESFEFGKEFLRSQYAQACFNEYRMAIQPTFKVIGHAPPASFGCALDKPMYKQHMDTTNHAIVETPTAVGKLDWD